MILVIFTGGSNESLHSEYTGLFWATDVVSGILAVTSMVGNGLVIYTATRNTNTGPFKYLNSTVISLAITDFLFGLIGIPLIISYYYLGELSFTILFALILARYMCF